MLGDCKAGGWKKLSVSPSLRAPSGLLAGPVVSVRVSSRRLAPPQSQLPGSGGTSSPLSISVLIQLPLHWEMRPPFNFLWAVLFFLTGPARYSGIKPLLPDLVKDVALAGAHCPLHEEPA